MSISIKKRGGALSGASHTFFVLVPALALGLCANALARDFFDPAFIKSVGQSDPSSIPDLSLYATRDAQAPGEYRIDVILNNSLQETADIRFVEKKDPTTDTLKLVPCLSIAKLTSYGLRADAFPGLKEDADGCADTHVIPDFTTDFNFNTQQLLVSIPQAALSTIAQGFVSPDEFDDGINALLTNYQFSSGKDYEANNEYYNLNLQSGLNLGPWRLRNLSTWNKSAGAKSDWDSVYLYAQRSIVPLKSTLVMGESSSLSSIFDSVPFTGIQLATDTDMIPESLRGFAPIVRGIARTNARIVIKQNGYQIYQAFVAPGAFEITDLYSTGGNGDLYVTVEESDGSRQNFVVPYASLPLMLREGQMEYEITSGKYRPYDGNVDEKPFTQATISYGVLSNTTLYTGVQAAANYQALAFGAGQNLGDIGAVSADVTAAWSKKKDEEKTSGQSWRIRYGKNILETGTNITVAGYRYSTSGYNTLTDVMNTYNNSYGGYTPHSLRNRTNITVSQSLGSGLGNLSVSGIFEDYWDSNRRNNSLNIGYNGGFRRFNYYAGYSYSRYSWGNNGSSRHVEDDHVVSFNISIPLSDWLPNAYATYNVTNSSPGSTDQYVSLSGVALENHNLDWNVQQGYSNREDASGGVYGNYRGSMGSANAGYSYAKNSQLINYGLSGGVLVHADGITLGQEMSETAVLVKAPGLKNVRLENDATIETDYRGYAIIPYVTPYHRTSVTLDSTTLGDNMELPNTTQKVVPTRAAVVRANFAGNIGRRAFLILKRASGENVPYGATVTLTTDKNAQASIVSDGGMVYLSGLKDNGEVYAQWGSKSGQQCKAPYSLAAVNEGIAQATAVCQ
ncbi:MULTISPECIES: fimbria/pilus outer membrane usher protein [Klebsiella]|uniref:fimbria/pilus outer membrane usher protein n=1 Tax=Klebsiella TaxID=570 RepID=UPI0007CCCC3D|nr:fimbria/pilus outer membrane usher protein [Klebsiella oxytoca]MBG2616146.1 fimbrial biogenesis outer membrane usher protein [Klebsiella oxytoca]MBZ7320025.1 fimbrial biogenesis outer membrane usher protein [Klebsiella oxytoca]MCW9543491.1 fimbrial biogenesis outer membrane usher protein [Klebsiella oxytoca]MCW9564867.1 fimbrial biogenesis outer membrane usher protein [Klebsiella oxytoca]MCW9575577.1 fimbrial biogenesis outer membrane usher protein [Klebsiella oxytoca]